MKSRIEKLEENITALKKQLLELGPIHPGSLSKQIRKKMASPMVNIGISAIPSPGRDAPSMCQLPSFSITMLD